MSDRFNTIFGWVLFSGIILLGLSSIFGKVFHADHPERPEKMGYVIEGVEEAGGGEQGPSLAAVLAEADPAVGEKLFAKCISCHTVDAGGADGNGPNLHGVMGKGIAKQSADFAYSSALAEMGGNWDFDNMDAWLTSPRRFASGTKMSFAGFSKIEDRAAMIAYMNSLGSNLPLPEVVEAAPAEDGDAEAEGAADAEQEVEAEAEEAAASE